MSALQWFANDGGAFQVLKVVAELLGAGESFLEVRT